MRTTALRIFTVFLIALFLITACGTEEPTTPEPADAPAEEEVIEETVQETTTEVEPEAEGGPETAPTGSDAPITATLSEIIGTVLAKAGGEANFTEVGAGFMLEPMGQVQTESNSKVRLDLSDKTLIRLGENSQFTLELPEEKDDGGLLTRLKLAFGEIWVILDGGEVEVETPSGVAAVHGSFLYIDSDPDNALLRITCLEGECSLRNDQGEVHITAGQTAFITATGNSPETGIMTEEDFQNWLDNNPESTPHMPKGEDPRPEGTVDG